MAYKIPFISPSASLVSFTATNVDGKTVGNTSLGTVASGETFLPIFFTLTVVSATGSGTGASVGAGTNSPSYQNITSSSLFVSANVGLSNSLKITGSIVVPSSSAIFLRVTTAATYTTYVFNYSLIGYYLP